MAVVGTGISKERFSVNVTALIISLLFIRACNLNFFRSNTGNDMLHRLFFKDQLQVKYM